MFRYKFIMIKFVSNYVLLVYINYFSDIFKPLDQMNWMDEIWYQINFDTLMSFDLNYIYIYMDPRAGSIDV
jgi:hypothetical protein